MRWEFRMTRAQIKRREETCRTRPVVQRLRWIAGVLRAKGELPSTQKLGKRFKMSYKTVTRDLDLMRDFFKYPLAYDAKTYTYKLIGSLPEPIL